MTDTTETPDTPPKKSRNSPNDVPSFIYGTAWKEEETARLTRLALEAGFRAIDTANQRKHYYEVAVGEALQEAFAGGLLTRDELFLQTKFTHLGGQDDRLPYDPDAAVAQQVRQSCQSSLRHLGVEVIDSYLLHGPTSRMGLREEDIEAWQAMEELYDDGLVRSIGVSNVSPAQLASFIELARLPVGWVQNRCFARSAWDSEVRDICAEHGVRYQGFSLLTANQSELDDVGVRGIAARYDATIAQVVFRFAMQIGIVPLTGTTDPEHMRDDLRCDEFELTEAEIEAIRDVAL